MNSLGPVPCEFRAIADSTIITPGCSKQLTADEIVEILTSVSDCYVLIDEIQLPNYYSKFINSYFFEPRPIWAAWSIVCVPCCLSMRFSKSVGSFLAVTFCWLMMSMQA